MRGLLKDYPSAISSAAFALTQHPEILSILADNLNMTIVLGDLYNRDPEQVIALTDSLAIEAARRNAQELEDWKQGLAEDPEALQQLEAAARNYAEDNDYAREDYDRPVDQRQVEVHHHHYQYPHFTNHCVRFQNRHRTSVSSFNRNIDHPNRPVTTQAYLKKKRKQYPAIVKDEVKPVHQPSAAPIQRPRVETVRPNSYQNVNQGKDYHQDIWKDKQVNPRPSVRPSNPGTTPSVSPNANKFRQPRTATPSRNLNKRK